MIQPCHYPNANEASLKNTGNNSQWSNKYYDIAKTQFIQLAMIDTIIDANQVKANPRLFYGIYGVPLYLTLGMTFEMPCGPTLILMIHDDVIKWKHFPSYWPFGRRNHWSPVNYSHKGQWGRALVFSLICAWINGWVNNRDADDLRCHRGHYDVTVTVKCYEICRRRNGHTFFFVHILTCKYHFSLYTRT